jgi:hypothetical protein
MLSIACQLLGHAVDGVLERIALLRAADPNA